MLSSNELCRLCAAIEPSARFEHRLGMGRPIGLGSVKLSIQQLQLINRRERLEAGEQSLFAVDAAHLVDWGRRKTHDLNSNYWRALLLTGEPHRIRHPVHYPQVTPGALPPAKRDGSQPEAMKGRIENLNYQWWMANDKRNADRQLLTPVNETPPQPGAIQARPNGHSRG